jgi:hypothetical protein
LISDQLDVIAENAVTIEKQQAELVEAATAGAAPHPVHA